jgi:PKD repeat protein
MENTFLKKEWVIGIILLFIGASVVSGFNTTSSYNPKSLDRGWLYVGGSGPGNYTVIQSAINDANPGDTVYVYNGIYYENILFENNDIHLIGEDKNTTIIDASTGIGSGVFIYNCDYTNISRFTIRNAQLYAGGEEKDGHGVYILAYSMGERGETANNNTLFNCIICNNSKYGVYLHAYDVDVSVNNNLIQNCEISNNGLSGIWFSTGEWWEGVCHAINNKILSSKIYNNGVSEIPIGWGYRTGITLSVKGVITQTLISNCDIIGNRDCGVWIKYSEGQYPVGDNNTIFHNNFYNITNNAYDEFNNSWNNETIQEGNYWADYTGEDNNHDGIGDTPYNISGGSNQDLYPFMEPNGWLNEPPVANFTYTIDELAVTFNASSSYDPDGNISTWMWEFGDGTAGAGEIVTHNYPRSGTYTVILQVKDDDGKHGNIIQEITVESYKKAIIFGRIANLTTVGDTITFEMVNTRVITFNPYSWIPYTSGEKIIISNGYSGFIGYRYVFALCRILI